MLVHLSTSTLSSALLSVASSNTVSVTTPALAGVGVWTCVAHAINSGIGVGAVASHRLGGGIEETILMAPVVRVTGVSGLLVKSSLTEMVRKPFGVTLHPQHSAICWSALKT